MSLWAVFQVLGRGGFSPFWRGRCSGLAPGAWAGMKTQAGRGPVGRVALFFQEQIQGPENASIARFDGLGCYQSSSEKKHCLSECRAGRPKPVRGRALNGL